MDWQVTSIVATIVISLGTLFWGVASHKQRAKATDDEHIEATIGELQKWNGEVTLAIEQLRQEIDHVKEIGNLKDAATREHLARMETKMDELLGIIIRWMDKTD